jgi:hypothetical protein
MIPVIPMTMIPVSPIPSVTYVTLAADEVGVEIPLSQYFTLTDPYLDPDLTIYRQRKNIRIIDIHPQRMKRRPPLLDLLRTGDLSATKPAGNLDLDPLGAHPQRRSNRHLDRPLVIDAVFDLARDRISYDIRIQLRPADLQDIDLNVILSRQFLQLLLDPVHLTTAFTDDDPGLGSVDRHNQLVQRTLDDDLGNPTLIDTGKQVGPDLVVLDQLGSIVFLAAIPVGFPTANDPQPGPNRIRFLTHVIIK